jgi:isoleucyl-tRNA synthetase
VLVGWQWFARLEGVHDAAEAALQHVQFVPLSGRARLESFQRGRNLWCISRQRAWGCVVRLPPAHPPDMK